MSRVTQWPIAVCDASTVSQKDCYAVDTVFPHYASELYHIGHNEAHRWFYLNEQTNEEVLIMQVYDSDVPEMAGKHRSRSRVPPPPPLSSAKYMSTMHSTHVCFSHRLLTTNLDMKVARMWQSMLVNVMNTGGVEIVLRLGPC